MTNIITSEMRAAMMDMLRDELERREREKRENRTMYQRLCRDFEEDFNAFNFVEEKQFQTPDGRQVALCWDRNWYGQLRGAFGAILRSVYGVNHVAKLPADREQEMREMMRGIFDIMKSCRKGEMVHGADCHFERAAQ